MHYYPDTVKKIIEHFDGLPGIGPKHAMRLAFYLLDNKNFSQKFSGDIEKAIASVQFCSHCYNIADESLCVICRDTHRDQKTVCVIAHVQDLESVERTRAFSGVYHILHGMVNPIAGVTPDHIKIKELFDRIEKDDTKEIILALDATSEGEATTLYLKQKLQNKSLKITTLARGIPMGSSIEYTDEVTLLSAFENRK